MRSSEREGVAVALIVAVTVEEGGVVEAVGWSRAEEGIDLVRIEVEVEADLVTGCRSEVRRKVGFAC